MLYLYENPSTGEIKEIHQSINDKHEYFEGGNRWNRVFTTAQISNSTKCDPNSVKDWSNKTKQGNFTVGDLWDKSAELSEKRKDKDGIDKVQNSYFDNYSKKRRGIKHNLDTRP